VGEVAFLRGAGRREIGHGALAERSISAVLPTEDKWPYAMRVVSDILESNGSSSMATVCGASLSMMDAGVPLEAPVAGVAMGLVKEGEKYAILTDIAGAEDHYGDMDFKVAGTSDGITALQMDIKVMGITPQIMREALAQAQRGRLFILEKMQEVISTPRDKVSAYAPRIYTLQIPVDKIRDVIGPGGKMIRSIIEQTGVKIDVEDSGRVNVASNDEASASTALQMDIKVSGINAEIMTKALEQARVGRMFILGKMQQTLSASRSDVSTHAPRIITIRIPVDKIRDVIGPGGKMIRSIIERTGVKIDVEDDGRVNVASADGNSAQKAISIIQELTATPEMNKTYLGKVQRITDFGAFVEIMPGTDGLLHVSEIAHYRV
jgi:polyribonucleotide nucleotidyltransferase